MTDTNDFQRFKLSIEDYVAVVTIDCPPVNAQDSVFREEIVRLFDGLSDDDQVRAVVLTADGKMFSAGADMRERSGLSDSSGAYLGHNRRVRASFDAVFECSKPVIAAVNGGAIGAGSVLALCCDIIMVAEDAYMSMTEVNVGLAGGVRHVLRHFGQSDARYMIFSAERITGPELLRMNVASFCLPETQLMDEALSLAQKLAAKSPLAIQAAKRSFGMTEEMPLRDGYRYEQTQTAALSHTEDTKEAQAAFREKRAPVFKGR